MPQASRCAPTPREVTMGTFDFASACIVGQHRCRLFDAVVVDLGEWISNQVEITIHNTSTTFSNVVVPEVVVEHFLLVF
jgi:hypothetical protein